MAELPPNFIEHLALARAQTGQCLAQAARLGIILLRHAGCRQRLLHPVHQFVVVKRLFQKIPGTLLDRSHRGAHIAMPGQKQYRPRAAQCLELVKNDRA